MLKQKFIFLIMISVLSISMGAVQAQDSGDAFDSIFSDEEISCESLSSILSNYNKDSQMNRHAFYKTLQEVLDFLQKVSAGDRMSRSELTKLIESLQEAQTLSTENNMILSSKALDIEEALEECL